jgi:hypothetical protein
LVLFISWLYIAHPAITGINTVTRKLERKNLVRKLKYSKLLICKKSLRKPQGLTLNLSNESASNFKFN